MSLTPTANATVNVPTLPINILTMMVIFPMGERRDVIPVERPTVPSAETSSKAKSSKSLPSMANISDSEIERMKIPNTSNTMKNSSTE